MKNHTVMIVNALILIIMGGIGFIMSGSPTALIADAAGIILLILSFPVKNENHIAAHIGVVITLLVAISFMIVGVLRGNVMIIIMSVVSFIALDLYILSFIKRKKEREAKANSLLK